MAEYIPYATTVHRRKKKADDPSVPPSYGEMLVGYAGGIPRGIAETLGGAGVRVPGLISAPEQRPLTRAAPAGTASDTVGAPAPPDAATEAQDWEKFIPPPTGPDPGIEAFQGRTSRYELPEGAGHATVLSRSPGGSGEEWAQEQAGREQGRQVFGVPPPPARGGIEASRPEVASEAQASLQGDADQAGGTTRRAPPSVQRRWLGEFQAEERQRYGQQDAIEAALEAEVAKQQATQEDPTGIGAKEAEILATTAGQKELIGAQAEADYGIEQKRSEAFAIRSKEIEAEYEQERARLEASEAFQDASPKQQREDMADLQGRFDALRKQAQMETFASQDPRAIRYMQNSGFGLDAFIR